MACEKGEKEMMAAIGFVVGFFAGEVVGVLAAAVLIISSNRE